MLSSANDVIETKKYGSEIFFNAMLATPDCTLNRNVQVTITIISTAISMPDYIYLVSE